MNTQADQQRSTELIASCTTLDKTLEAIASQGFAIINPGDLTYELKQLWLKQALPIQDWGFVMRTKTGWELRRYKRQPEVTTELVVHGPKPLTTRMAIIDRGLSSAKRLEVLRVGESCAVFMKATPREDWGFVMRTSEGWELHRHVHQPEPTYHKDARAFIA